MNGTNFAILAYVIGLGLLLGYAVMLGVSLRKAKGCETKCEARP